MRFVWLGIRAFVLFCRVGVQTMFGVWRIGRLPRPIITIFGAKLAREDDLQVIQAHKLAHQLAINGFSILSGGGPGFMHAVNCGAAEATLGNVTNTLGIGVYGVDEDFHNPCAHVIKVSTFFARKWLLIKYSSGFVLFPGGIGTVDELFELLNAMKLSRLQRVPIILVGKEYWQPLFTWLHDFGFRKGFIMSNYISLFTLTDSMDEIAALLNKSKQSSRTP